MSHRCVFLLIAALPLTSLACSSPDKPEEDMIVVVTDKADDTMDPSDSDEDDPNVGSEEEEEEEEEVETPAGLDVLGKGTHSPEGLEVVAIASASDGLTGPRDAEFNPEAPEQLWIVNQNDHSAVIVFNPGTPEQSSQRYAAPGNRHFLAKPSALAFGASGAMATAHQEDEKTQPTTPADFMGPTLWSTDLNIFDGGHGGHLDMLHNSPMGAGIAWEKDNAYWVFDGYHDSLTRYDFVGDHGPGGSDHTDGIIHRYVEGEVQDVPGVVSHMVFDAESGLLYVADTGNNRIATLNPEPGTPGPIIAPNYDGINVQRHMEGAELVTFIDGAEAGLEKPAGLELYDGHLWVTDNATSRVYAFDMEGTLVDYLDLLEDVPAGGLMGMAFDESGRLYVVDAASDTILRIAPAPGTDTP